MEDNYRTWYEVFVYSFYDGNGVGDLKGLTEKMDYINDGNPETMDDLGCNGIWLMPIMPSTTYHKYDVTDYCGIGGYCQVPGSDVWYYEAQFWDGINGQFIFEICILQSEKVA